jgi:hypothetical protein
VTPARLAALPGAPADHLHHGMPFAWHGGPM